MVYSLVGPTVYVETVKRAGLGHADTSHRVGVLQHAAFGEFLVTRTPLVDIEIAGEDEAGIAAASLWRLTACTHKA